MLKLRPIVLDDYYQVLGWSKDEEFCLANGWELNRSKDELYDWWVHCVNLRAEEFIRIGIEHKGILVGYADLVLINEHTVELGIAIGDSKLWGKGIGTIAAKDVIDYAKEKIGVHNFNAETHEDNLRSQKMLQKLGFQEISRIGTEKYSGKENQLIQYRLSY